MSTQQYEKYSADDQRVWSVLYTRQLVAVEKVAYKKFLTGIRQLGFADHKIPRFAVINARLIELTGWQIYEVPGLIPNSDFFESMLQKKFGATTWLRKMEELDYLIEPDMFHDVFGHIPLLTDSSIAIYLHNLAQLAVRYINNEEAVEAIARLYWYTVEFGLVREENEIKIYGAGILSSIGETEYCLSAGAMHVPFDLETIIDTPYIKDNYQEKYFVVNSLRSLQAVVKQLEQLLKARFENSFRAV